MLGVVLSTWDVMEEKTVAATLMEKTGDGITRTSVTNVRETRYRTPGPKLILGHLKDEGCAGKRPRKEGNVSGRRTAV